MAHTDFTKQEAEFAEIIEGPNDKYVTDILRDSHPHQGRDGESAPEDARVMLARAQQLASGPVLGALQEASDDLYAWASTRVANQPDVKLEDLLEEMTQYGLGDLAAEAAAILEKIEPEKAGHRGRFQIGDTKWNSEGPGVTAVEIDGEPYYVGLS